MQAVTEQPIKNFFFSNSSVSLATNHWPKSLRTLGTRVLSFGHETKERHHCNRKKNRDIIS